MAPTMGVVLSVEVRRLPRLMSSAPALQRYSQQLASPVQPAAVFALAWLSVQHVSLRRQTLARDLRRLRSLGLPASERGSHSHLREIQIAAKERACWCYQQRCPPYVEATHLLVGVANRRHSHRHQR